MSNDTVIAFTKPTEFPADPLTDIVRKGARELLATAVAAEVSEFLAAHAHLLDEEGRARLVRHGFLPEREVTTGIGKVRVQMPRVRDRGLSGEGSKIRFSSSLVPPYLRKSKSVEELLPWLYLKGISTGDFSEALAALLGPDGEGLSSSTITRLKATWQEEYETWRKRDLSGKRYVYFCADGVYFTPRLDDDRQCMLVIIPTATNIDPFDGRKSSAGEACLPPWSGRPQGQHNDVRRAIFDHPRPQFPRALEVVTIGSW